MTFDLSIRMPGWMASPLEVMVDGEKADYTTDEHGFAHVVRTWHKQAVTIRIGKRLSCYPLPERQWQSWRPRWKTYHQPFGIEFRPLYGIGHEAYTVYFPVVKK